MRNAIALLVVLAIGALGTLVYTQESTIRQQEQSVQQLTAQLRASRAAITAASLDLQEKCAKQAHELFKDLGWEKQQTASYANHYNVDLNKCFIVIQSTTQDTKNPDQMFTNEILLNAFEGTSYGDFMWHSEKDKKYWEVPPWQCNFTLPSGEHTVCHSQAAFEELLKTYMGSSFH